jgi:catechol 2,3-dioxygenase-like lactoylglutathione lyase family enzyme
MELSGVVLGTPDPDALASFYQRLLGWPRIQDEPDWVKLGPPAGGPGLSFQLEVDHQPPVWPSGPGDQQMQIHLDIKVEDLAEASRHAIEAGATLAAYQGDPDDVWVHLDPDGHPFCLFLN